jgi:Rab-GTPase-TBC domain
MTKTMPKARLLAILREYGEYPSTYRQMMWKALLQLPENCEAFATLLNKDLYPSVSNYDKRFSLVDHKAHSSLKQIISCLAYWSNLFGNVKYLPKFVFPFIKMSRGDLLFCFEVIATILLNHSQLWFEFMPLQVPYNYLNLVENVLMEMDRKLCEYYKSKGITSQFYALPLIESAFSEVLDESQWLVLWDHVISNESFFLIFVIAAYNSALRTTIMRNDNIDTIKQMFFEQNYVNMKVMLRKAYTFMEKCPSAIHPKHFMTSFMPLTRGNYQKFEHYPKNLINANVMEVDALREEQKVLDQKLADLENFEKSIEARMESILIDEEYRQKMRGQCISLHLFILFFF